MLPQAVKLTAAVTNTADLMMRRMKTLYVAARKCAFICYLISSGLKTLRKA
jgi:hypothetical protein